MKEIFIVESQTDANELIPCLAKFLKNGEYATCVCKGHIREIREGNTYKREKDYGIDLNTFTPDYVIKDPKIVSKLKKEISGADMVYLVTDQDREGEAIAWHLKEVLGLKKYKRMPCYEYTYKTVKKAYDNAGQINKNLVESQVGRAVLDKLVGYDISPLIQKKFYINSLSGGRIQSVALKFVCDREKEILNFIPEDYYDISADLFSVNSSVVFNAKLVGFSGKKIGDRDIKTEEFFNEILSDLNSAKYVVNDIKTEEKTAQKVRPFKATTMQKASPWDPDKTMSIAQRLKDKNLITYHRTDSTRVPEDKIMEAESFIESNYGKEYTSFYIQPGKEKGVQDGHVAIMPTDTNKTPNSDSIKSLTSDEKKLYTLIWRQFIAAMMAPEKYLLTVATIGANKCEFRASGSVTTFDGASKVMKNSDSKRVELPNLSINEILELKELKNEKKQTKPPVRYDERSLAAKLDEEKIGRPSTISTYPKTLKQRKYVVKDTEDKKLHPTELGMNVCDDLSDYIKSIMNVQFTSLLEEQLDDIADGNLTKTELLQNFYPKFCDEIKLAQNEMEKPVMLEEKCPKCGASLQIKHGKYGKFVCCSNYPKCDYYKDDKPKAELLEAVCPECGSPLQEKEGRFGKFVGCSAYPKCKYIQKEIPKTYGQCPKCKSGNLEVKKSRKGTFYGCSNYPKCDFASWYEPTETVCEKCGYPMGVRKTKTISELKCLNKDCGNAKKL